MNSRPLPAQPEPAIVPVPGRIDPLARALGAVMLFGVAFITVTCILVQFLRTDLNWFTTAMSIYVVGPYGPWVRASLYAPAPGIAALGIGWYRSLNHKARSVIPLTLFIAGAVGLCILASYTTDTTPKPVTVHGMIHQWSTFGAFVCITTAALVQSWDVRRDPRWRFRFIPAITVAAVAVTYFWIYALVKPIPRGIGEKVVIGLVLLWLWRAAWWLVVGPAITDGESEQRSQSG